MELIRIATLFRVINLYAHHAHNLTRGNTFFEDHAFFGELYNLADDFYDALIERYLGTIGNNVDLNAIMAEAAGVVAKSDNDFFKTTQIMVEHAIKRLDTLSKSNMVSEGTKNLLQGQADQLEVIIYKLKRRNS